MVITLALSNLNNRLRYSGLSAREMLFQRDQFFNCQTLFDDKFLIDKQHYNKLNNHNSSMKSKGPINSKISNINFQVGDIVYLFSDRDKHKSRSRYIVKSLDNEFCFISKLTENQFRNVSYKVRLSDCFKVPAFIHDNIIIKSDTDTDNDFVDSSQSHCTVSQSSDADVVNEHDYTLCDIPDVNIVNQGNLFDASDTDCTEVFDHSTSLQPSVSINNFTDSDSSRPKRTIKLPDHLCDYDLAYESP